MASDLPGMAIPADWELIGFFEAEPELADTGEDQYGGWHYNTLKFRTQRGEDVIECVLSPAFGELTLRWSKYEIELIELALCFGRILTVHSDSGREWMEVEFEEEKYLLPFLLQLKPTVKVEWGTTRWL
jgi:hypothetical protein